MPAAPTKRVSKQLLALPPTVRLCADGPLPPKIDRMSHPTSCGAATKILLKAGSGGCFSDTVESGDTNTRSLFLPTFFLQLIAFFMILLFPPFKLSFHLSFLNQKLISGTSTNANCFV